MLRPLSLPASIPGRLYLTRMPGYKGDYAAERDAIRQAGVNSVLCLAPLDEIAEKSPPYAQAIQAHLIPWKQWMLPVPDFGAPADRDAWLAHIREAGERLKQGETLAIHCAAGIGRTGTAAVCLLMALGMGHEEARQAVIAAGSDPEAADQVELIEWVATVLGKGSGIRG